MTTSRPHWFGSYPLEMRDTRSWQIGPFSLWLTREEHELHVAYRSRGDAMDSTTRISERSAEEDIPEDAHFRRFGFRRSPDSLTLTPCLADRALVVNAEKAFLLPPSEEITLYIASTVWIEATAGEPGETLFEEAIHPLSDTWFGPSTMDGELCYASKIAARSILDNLPRRDHLAVSAIVIRNQASSALALKSLKIPLPRMSLFTSPDGRLWTEELTLVRDEDDTLASVRLGSAPPSHAGARILVRGPRSIHHRAPLIRAFSNLLG